MRATLRDLAEELGVSQMTVSRALRGASDVSAATVRRARAAAERLGYRPSAAARAMRRQASRQVGILLRNAPDRPRHNLPGFELVLGIAHALEQAGHVATLVRLGDLGPDGRPTGRVFEERLLDGLIVIDRLPAVAYHRVAELMPHRVWLETEVWEPTGCLRRDEETAGRLCAERVLAAGYRHLVWLGDAHGPHSHSSGRERFAGVAAVAEECGVELVDIPAAGWRLDAGLQDRLHAALVVPGTAVIAYDQLNASWLARDPLVRWQRLGPDLGLACCDETGETAVTWPQLSRVTNDRYALGQRAAAMMLRQLDGEAVPSERVGVAWHAGTTTDRSA